MGGRKGIALAGLSLALIALLAAWAWGAFGDGRLDEPVNTGFKRDVSTLRSSCPGAPFPATPAEARRALARVGELARRRPGARVVLDDSGDRPGAPVGDSGRRTVLRLADDLASRGRHESARRLTRRGGLKEDDPG